jgi:hypothetical protein
VVSKEAGVREAGERENAGTHHARSLFRVGNDHFGTDFGVEFFQQLEDGSSIRVCLRPLRKCTAMFGQAHGHLPQQSCRPGRRQGPYRSMKRHRVCGHVLKVNVALLEAVEARLETLQGKGSHE